MPTNSRRNNQIFWQPFCAYLIKSIIMKKIIIVAVIAFSAIVNYAQATSINIENTVKHSSTRHDKQEKTRELKEVSCPSHP
jgi:hypothetical protein